MFQCCVVVNSSYWPLDGSSYWEKVIKSDQNTSKGEHVYGPNLFLFFLFLKCVALKPERPLIGLF